MANGTQITGITRTENGPSQFCRGALERGIDTHLARTYTTLHYGPNGRYHFCDAHPAEQAKQTK